MFAIMTTVYLYTLKVSFESKESTFLPNCEKISLNSFCEARIMLASILHSAFQSTFHSVQSSAKPTDHSAVL